MGHKQTRRGNIAAKQLAKLNLSHYFHHRRAGAKTQPRDFLTTADKIACPWRNLKGLPSASHSIRAAQTSVSPNIIFGLRSQKNCGPPQHSPPGPKQMKLAVKLVLRAHKETCAGVTCTWGARTRWDKTSRRNLYNMCVLSCAHRPVCFP